MKTKRVAVWGALAVLAASFTWAQGRGKAEASFSGKKVAVDYGQPALQGRDMLGKARPGMVWRFGKDAATMLNSEADLQFGDVTVPKGSYSLFAKKVDENTWHLIVNKQTGQWGTDHNADMDLAEIPLKTNASPDSVETFTIKLSANGNKGTLSAAWGAVVLSADFTAK